MTDQIAEMKYFQKVIAQHNKALSPNLYFIQFAVGTYGRTLASSENSGGFVVLQWT